MTALQARIRRFVADRKDGASDAEIYAAFPRVARPTVHDALLKLVEAGRLAASRAYTWFVLREAEPS